MEPITIRWETGYMNINPAAFFPTSTARIRKLLRVIALDIEHAQFEQMARTAYDGFTAAIDEYIEALEAKGNADLTAITEAMKEFQRNSMNQFNEWFATVQSLLDEDVAGHLVNKTNELDERLALMEYMIIHNDLFAPILDDDGNPILDDDGNALIGDWKYKTA